MVWTQTIGRLQFQKEDPHQIVFYLQLEKMYKHRISVIPKSIYHTIRKGVQVYIILFFVFKLLRRGGVYRGLSDKNCQHYLRTHLASVDI